MPWDASRLVAQDIVLSMKLLPVALSLVMVVSSNNQTDLPLSKALNVPSLPWMSGLCVTVPMGVTD
jgi:hypothetical protein